MMKRNQASKEEKQFTQREQQQFHHPEADGIWGDGEA